MSSRQVVVVPADRTMNLQKLSDVSTLIAPDAADIHLVRVHPRDAWRPYEDVLSERSSPAQACRSTSTMRTLQMHSKRQS